MTYQEKLKDPRWQRKRLEILERDDWTCQCCESKTKTLTVHHKKYNFNPWDAENNDMQALCVDCHDALGPHPMGGIWWGSDGRCVVIHCPKCSNKDTWNYGRSCTNCGHSLITAVKYVSSYSGFSSCDEHDVIEEDNARGEAEEERGEGDYEP